MYERKTGFATEATCKSNPDQNGSNVIPNNSFQTQRNMESEGLGSMRGHLLDSSNLGFAGESPAPAFRIPSHCPGTPLQIPSYSRKATGTEQSQNSHVFSVPGSWFKMVSDKFWLVGVLC